MSYTPTTWTTGDTITASALNKIENGIASAGGVSYIPIEDDGSTYTSTKTVSEIMAMARNGATYFVLIIDDNETGEFRCVYMLISSIEVIPLDDVFMVNTVEGLAFEALTVNGYPSVTY